MKIKNWLELCVKKYISSNWNTSDTLFITVLNMILWFSFSIIKTLSDFNFVLLYDFTFGKEAF